MAGSLNKVQLIGKLGKDPEIRNFNNGGSVANFSIATSESWKDKASGERKERTEWHRISILNPALVSIAERYLRKGDSVYIEGQLETRKYEKDGRDVYTTEVVLRPYRGTLTMLGSKAQRGGGQADTAEEYAADAQTAAAGPGAAGCIDDEIPF